MNSLLFRTMAPLITVIMLVFSAYICLRGHNEPGGGFIGGLIAAAALAIYAMAAGVEAVRQALRVEPLAIAGFGVVIAALSGLASLLTEKPFMSSIWWPVDLGDASFYLSTPMVFDIGVYCVVLGSIAAIALALEGEEA